MDEQRIAEIEAREQAATKGPWEYWEHIGVGKDEFLHGVTFGPDGFNQTCMEQSEDSWFTAHARQDIPDLIAAWREQQQRIASLEQALNPNWREACEIEYAARKDAEQRIAELEAERDGLRATIVDYQVLAGVLEQAAIEYAEAEERIAELEAERDGLRAVVEEAYKLRDAIHAIEWPRSVPCAALCQVIADYEAAQEPGAEPEGGA